MLDGDYDHRLPYPGDGGVRFEPRDAAKWQASVMRQMMDGELDGCERLPELYAVRAAEAQGAAVAQDR